MVGTPPLVSRLPDVGTTIFTKMSALAAESNAVNLGQGFPDFDCDPSLVELVAQAMRDGFNQYAPMAGVPALRQAISDKIARLYDHCYDWQSEITITAGATQALLTAILAVVHAGDEVILLEPTYDSYLPSVELALGKPVFFRLEPPDYVVDVDRLSRLITSKTRLIIINTPQNPTGAIWRREEMKKFEDLLRGTDILVLSDEVYEHIVFDGARHESVSRYPALAERSIVVSSFGKTFHVTGWKVGYVAAPEPLMNEFRKVHQYNVFTVNSAVQVGLAEYMKDPKPYLNLNSFYQEKRDLFRAGLSKTPFKLLPCAGTYFQCVDYSELSDLSEVEFAQWLTREVGVAAIPLSVFYKHPYESGIVRFCFAKSNDTLDLALSRLAGL